MVNRTRRCFALNSSFLGRLVSLIRGCWLVQAGDERRQHARLRRDLRHLRRAHRAAADDPVQSVVLLLEIIIALQIRESCVGTLQLCSCLPARPSRFAAVTDTTALLPQSAIEHDGSTSTIAHVLLCSAVQRASLGRSSCACTRTQQTGPRAPSSLPLPCIWRTAPRKTWRPLPACSQPLQPTSRAQPTL